MKVLLISPYFAPYIGVGALRMTSLADYLTRQGVEVTVIKMDTSCYESGMVRGESPTGISYVTFKTEKHQRHTAKKLYPLIDTLCSNERFDCCVVSCGPFYTVRPAIYLRQKHHIPLVADYRDLWVNDPRSKPATLREMVFHALFRCLYYPADKKLMSVCSAFVGVTPQYVQQMVADYPVLKDKALCIYNGYQPIMLPSPPNEERPSFQLFILGKYSYYSLKGASILFDAIKMLLDKGYSIKVLHAGVAEEQTRTLLEKHQLPETCYVELGQLPYSQAMSIAQNADAGFLIWNSSFGLGTKVFDYIYLNKPIIAYVPDESEIVSLLRETENFFAGQSKQQLATAIETIMTEKRSILTENSEFRNRFSRESQNRKYYDLLKSLKTKTSFGAI